MKITSQDIAILLFLALWVVIALYIGAKRELDIQKEATNKIYEMLTPTQKKMLQEEYEFDR